jgi:CheY-like chemotaxis protein
MDADPAPRSPGSFRALGERLLRESFPASSAGDIERHVERAMARIRRTAGTHPQAARTEARSVVLIVDDEADLRDVMRRMLERRGFATLLADSTEEALSVCRSHAGDVDFAIVDLGLPGVAGGEFTTAVAALRPGLRTVFLSGLPRDRAIADRLIDADDLLVKQPFTVDDLVALLREEEAHQRRTAR